MRTSLIITILLAAQFTWADTATYTNIITNPAISRRCKTLLSERSDKIKVQQKLNALLLRSRKLIKSLKPNQKSLKQKLMISENQVQNRLRLTKIRINSMEENIVRKGCPGISL